MANLPRPIHRFLAIGGFLHFVRKGLFGWGWFVWFLVSSGWVGVTIQLLREWWVGLPLAGQLAYTGATFAAGALVVGGILGLFRRWWRARQGRLDDRLEVRPVQAPAMIREMRIEGNAEFWKIYAPVEITHRPKNPTDVVALDFALTAALFDPVEGRSSLELPESHMGGLFKDEVAGLVRYFRSPHRIQGPHAESGGLLFLLDPFTIEGAGGRENIDHNNSTLTITDRITGRTMSVVVAKVDWAAFGGRPGLRRPVEPAHPPPSTPDPSAPPPSQA
ncbi:hypothetical protein BH24GEM1_BH24GEM1_02540 [soil metagenome]